MALSRNAHVNHAPFLVVDSSVASAGSSISDATAMNADLSVLDDVTTAEGVILYNMDIGDSQEVYNDTSTECLVYPPTSSYQINQIAAGSAMILPGYTSCVFRKVTTTQIVAYLSG